MMTPMKRVIPLLLMLLPGAFLVSCKGPSKAEIATRDNMHKIHGAFMDYQEDNDDAFPATLDDLRPYVDNFDQFMTNPITGDNPGYQYIPPPTNDEEFIAADTVIVVQLRNGAPDESLRKLYADGVVD